MGSCIIGLGKRGVLHLNCSLTGAVCDRDFRDLRRMLPNFYNAWFFDHRPQIVNKRYCSTLHKEIVASPKIDHKPCPMDSTDLIDTTPTSCAIWG